MRLRLFTCPRSQLYHLASVRLRDLCAKLDIPAELRRKIWTCFEYSLLHCTDLMMDRHLDQLLMCAVYIMSKVCVCVWEYLLFSESIEVNESCFSAAR